MNALDNPNPRLAVDAVTVRTPTRGGEPALTTLPAAGQNPGRRGGVAHRDGLVTLNSLLERAAKPKVPTRDEELDGISTTRLFLAALRMVQLRSGRNPGQIAVASGIPRASVYALVKIDREHLPTKQRQVEQFLEACRLPERQIKIMLRIWMHLRNTRPPRPREIVPPRAPDESENIASGDASTYETTAETPGTLVGQLDWDQVKGTLVEDADEAAAQHTSGVLEAKRSMDTLPLSPELQAQLVVAMRDIAQRSCVPVERFGRSRLLVTGFGLAGLAMLLMLVINPERGVTFVILVSLVSVLNIVMQVIGTKVIRSVSAQAKKRLAARAQRARQREDRGPTPSAAAAFIQAMSGMAW